MAVSFDFHLTMLEQICKPDVRTPCSERQEKPKVTDAAMRMNDGFAPPGLMWLGAGVIIAASAWVMREEA